MRRRDLFGVICGWFAGFVACDAVAKVEHTSQIGNHELQTTSQSPSIAKDATCRQDPYTRWGWGDDDRGYHKKIWDTVELDQEFQKDVDVLKEAYELWSNALDGIMEAIQKNDDAYAHALEVLHEVHKRHYAKSDEVWQRIDDGNPLPYKQWLKQDMEFEYIRSETHEKVKALRAINCPVPG